MSVLAAVLNSHQCVGRGGAARRVPTDERSGGCRAVIELVRARGLPKMDIGFRAKADPYVLLRLGHGRRRSGAPWLQQQKSEVRMMRSRWQARE